MNAPDPWVRLAVDLHQLADRVASLVGSAEPATAVSFTVQPGPWNGTDEETIAAVNTVAQALLGVDGREKRVGAKVLHFDASGTVGEISVGVFRGLSRKAGAK